MNRRAGPTRVALIANCLAPEHPTGVDQAARALVQGLAARDDVACTVAATRERNPATWVPAGVSVRAIPGPRKLVHLGWLLAHRPRVDRYVDHPDIVHVTVPSFPVPSRAPVVYTIHDVMPLLHPEWFPRVLRWGFARAVADAVERASAVVASSTSTADSAINLLGFDSAKVKVVPVAIPSRYFEPVTPAEVSRAVQLAGVEPGRFALFVGEINERKNVTTLLRALAQLDESFELVVAGPEGRGAERVRSEIDRLGLRKRVRLLGFVAEDVLPGLMAAARALLQPSRYEGFGITPLEAMALGTPAIVAATSALPETVGDAAILVDPDDADAWAQAIAAFADDDRRAEMVSRGRTRVGTFTAERVAAETAALYRAVLDGRPL